MGAVADAVGDVVGGVVDAVGDVVETVGDAVEDVGGAVVDTVERAIENPIQTAAVIASIVNPALAPVLIPAGSAAQALDNGASFDDALKSAAVSYVASTVGAQVAPGAGSYAGELGADAATQAFVQGATRAAVSGATSAALTGRDIGDAMVQSLAGYGLRQGIDYGFNEAGQAIDNITGEVLVNNDGTLSSSLTGEDGINAVDVIPPETEPGVSESSPDGVAPEFGSEDYQYLPQTDTVGISEGSTDGVMPEFGTEENKFVAETPGLSGATGDSTFTEQTGAGISESSPDGVAPEVGTDVDAFGNEITDTNPYAPTYEAGVDYPLVDQAEIDASPDVIDMSTIPEGSSDALDAAKKYFKSQLVNQITGGVMRDVFGGNAPSGSNVNRSSLPFNLMSSIYGTGASADTDSTMGSLSDAEPPVDLGSSELFNPLGNATWAPQSKIGGLGFAGKYLNPESDSYYVSKEQEDRQKALDRLQGQQGWMTDEERQMLMDQAGVQDPNQASPFYDFNSGGFDPYKITYAADGGLMGHNPEFYSEGGASIGNRYVKGAGDGTSDSVPAMLASGEFVIPADVVSGLGNGDNDAGAKVLDSFMEEIRKHKRGGSARELPPDSKGPLSYLSSAMTKAKRK